MLCTSTDCEVFEKHPAFLLPPMGEEFIKVVWRDPVVYYNEEENCYHMILAAAYNKDINRHWAVSQLFKSKDLETWEKCEPIYAPYTYDTHECPDIFKIGDNWYLIFSTYTKTWETRYRIAKSPYGPWKVPQNDTLGGKAFYAAKTVSNGKDRYFVGWTSLKEGLKDNEKYHWGGCLTVHKVGVQQDGRLALSLINNIENAFNKEIEKEFKVITGNAKIEGETISFQNPSEFSLVKIGDVKDNFFVSFKAKNKNISKTFANNFGLLFFGNGKNIENWYQISVEANGNKLNVDRSNAYFFDSIYLNEEIITDLKEEFEVKLILENTCGVLYVNDIAAISFRCYDFKEGMIGFTSQDTAEIDISNIKLCTY
jgi:beta-fructofuranosidase